MKKYFLIGIIMAIVPNICFGAGARFTQLAREKERKMEELEKCLGSNKGLKIAGISTLGLTAVGVAGNVVEAKKIKDYDKNIESTSKSIAKTEEEISNKNAELAAIKAEKERKEKESQASVSTQKPATGENNVVVSHDDLEIKQQKCNDSGGEWQTDLNNCLCGDLTKLNEQTGECEDIQVEIPEVKIEEPQQTSDQKKNNDSNASNNAVSNYDKNCKNSGGTVIIPGQCQCFSGSTPDFTGGCQKKLDNGNKTAETTNNKTKHTTCTVEDFNNAKLTGVTEGWYDSGGRCVAKTCDNANGYVMDKNEDGTDKGLCKKAVSAAIRSVAAAGAAAARAQKTTQSDAGEGTSNETPAVQIVVPNFQFWTTMPVDNVSTQNYNLSSNALMKPKASVGVCGSKIGIDFGRCSCPMNTYWKDYGNLSECNANCNNFCTSGYKTEMVIKAGK